MEQGRQKPEPKRESILQGTIDLITFHSPESLYTVARIRPETGHCDPEALFSNDRATAVGSVPSLVEGQRVRLTGSWTTHPMHGRQFLIESAVPLPPLDRDGLVRFLSSSTFHGIGPTLAERIVDELGSDALAKIRDGDSALEHVNGLRTDVRLDLIESVGNELGAQEALAFLFGVGLGPVQAQKVARKLGRDVESKLRANPYLIARGISGIGFHLADRVARELGIEGHAKVRREAALLHALRDAAGDGHTLQSLDALIARTTELVGINQTSEEWLGDLRSLEREDQVVLCEDLRAGQTLAYLPPYHTSESHLSENLKVLIDVGPGRSLGTPELLAAAESAADLELHPDQRTAVLGLLAQPVALLTGGPGVGKTTIIRLVVELAEKASCKVVLASPTGRAAKRLAEATGREASTIHRLLGWEPGTSRFQHHGSNPIEADLIVVDEISMLDVILAHHLVKAIQPPTRLILVGDPNQLPSVSAGNVLADLLQSGCIPAYRLSHIYRQSSESLIVANAHRLLAGEMPKLPERGAPLSDFYFFPAEGDKATADRLIDVVTQRIPSRFGFEWTRDVQVLSPMYKGPCGVDALNTRLREAQGTGGREISWHDRTWRTGDRVIHTRNDYEKNVFNGDMGRIESIDSNGEAMTVRFPDRPIRYTRNEFNDLRPAFAITVHRSQGGEFPVIAIPIVMSHFTMLQRHLFYTAITRAQKLVVLVGSTQALRRATENEEVADRESALADRLLASR